MLDAAPLSAVARHRSSPLFSGGENLAHSREPIDLWLFDRFLFPSSASPGWQNLAMDRSTGSD